MKCAVHTEADAAGFCRNCGKALCTACTRDIRGILYCEACLADIVSKPQQPAASGSPGLAAILGIIPGLGAVYNGEYMKAVIHVVIFSGFVGVLSGDREESVKSVAGILLAAFIFYMAMDAFRTAKARMLGQAPPTALGNLCPQRTMGPIILIVLGVLFLLDKLDILSVNRFLDFWPVLLIVVGVALLRKRMRRV